MSELRRPRVSLLGCREIAQALEAPLADAGFDVEQGGAASETSSSAAVVDLAASDPALIEDARGRFSAVVGVLPEGAAVDALAQSLDALVRAPNAAVDLPHALRAALRARADRDELLRLRQYEEELRTTKEFLERLIDATVDGIVAADLRGRILLFNKGAERVTGFAAAEVVGRIDIGDLYGDAKAVDLMRRLREACSAGDGRVGPLRLEIAAKNGEVIPVDLAVALVSEGQQEVATVAVFRDLREQLRVEGELEATREKLAVAEKAAVVSELAGAAAHELNQPLTSVLGFSELLFRRAREDEKGREELGVILREAERMAAIVRKIGRITRYETTPYVGGTRIVDLDRASNPPPPVDLKSR